MEDKHARLRELPFLAVIETMGLNPSDFRTRKDGREWAGKCPVHNHTQPISQKRAVC